MKWKRIAAKYIDKQERVGWMTFTIFAKIFPKTRIVRELNNAILAELPSKLIRQILVLTCSLQVE